MRRSYILNPELIYTVCNLVDRVYRLNEGQVIAFFSLLVVSEEGGNIPVGISKEVTRKASGKNCEQKCGIDSIFPSIQ